MRIMVFMTTDCKTSADLDLKTPALRIRPCGRSFRWILCAAVYGWVAVSSHATVTPLASLPRPQSLAAVTGTLSMLHGLEAFYPVIGLLAAVASTYILRHRRVTQLAAMTAAER